MNALCNIRCVNKFYREFMNYNSSQATIYPFIIRYQQIFSYLFLFVGVYLFFNMDNQTWEIIKSSVSDAYIGVTSFVAGTLMLFFTLEKYLKIDVKNILLNKPKLEILISSFLGALPGCGGAIIVLTQYSRGKASFGSVVAALTATMGCLLYTSPSPRDKTVSRMPSSA